MDTSENKPKLKYITSNGINRPIINVNNDNKIDNTDIQTYLMMGTSTRNKNYESSNLINYDISLSNTGSFNNLFSNGEEFVGYNKGETESEADNIDIMSKLMMGQCTRGNYSNNNINVRETETDRPYFVRRKFQDIKYDAISFPADTREMNRKYRNNI